MRNTLLKYTNTWQHGTVSDRVQIVIRAICFVAIIAIALIVIPIVIYNSEASLTKKLVIGPIFVITTILGLVAYKSMPDNV